jgi:predicted MFS family arabinose efflux permease
VLLSSAVNQFFDPANESVLPEVASDEELAAANALMTISFTAAETIGFAAAGLIAARFSIAWAFYLDACTFVVSALCIMRLRITPLATDGASTAAMAFHQLRAGLRFVADTPALRSLLLLFVPVFIIFGFMNALLLPFADRALHADAFIYGLLEGLPVLGSVAGSLVMAVIAERLHAGQWIATSLLGMGLLFMIVAQMTSTPLVIGMLMVVHFAHTPAYLGRRLLLQRNTEREVRGRVNSVFFVARDVAYLLGMGASGLADYVNVRLLYVIGGTVLLLAGMWALRLPGLSQPRSEWRRRLASLRTPIEVAG